MKETKSLEAVHTSNFIKNKKTEKAFLKNRKKADYDLLVASCKS